MLINCIRITFTQLVGYPLHYFSTDLYQAWMDYTKQLFGIVVIFITQYWTPLKVTISGDKSMEGLFKINPNSKLLETHFGDRAVVISNHQLYSDWVFLWWISFTAKVHGNIFIMLKSSLRSIPLFGWGMKNYRFLFLSRSWAQDEKVLTEGLSKINEEKNWPAWLILFPEGTTLSRNGVAKTKEFAGKQVPEHKVPDNLLLPRSRGLRFSLEKLHESIEYVYDATIYYADIPEGIYGEDYFTLGQMYVRGIHPVSLSMYWRRYKISDIPWQDEALFEKWIYDRWYEKDLLLKSIKEKGVFEGPEESILPIEAPVELNNTISEVFKIFIVPVTTGLIVRLAYRAVSKFLVN